MRPESSRCSLLARLLQRAAKRMPSRILRATGLPSICAGSNVQLFSASIRGAMSWLSGVCFTDTCSSFPVAFMQKHFLPVLGTMHVPRSQLARQTVSFPVEQQQRVIAGGLKMPVVSTLLLFSVDRNFRAVHIQHHPLG